MNKEKQKTGGRQKGTPNKTTAKVKDWLGTILQQNMRQIKQDLKECQPKERLDFIAKVLPYIVPKQQQVQADITADFSQMSEAQLDYIAAQLGTEEAEEG